MTQEEKILHLEERLRATEAERRDYYERWQSALVEVEHLRLPAQEREFCRECRQPRDRECPHCGATYYD